MDVLTCMVVLVGGGRGCAYVKGQNEGEVCWRKKRKKERKRCKKETVGTANGRRWMENRREEDGDTQSSVQKRFFGVAAGAPASATAVALVRPLRAATTWRTAVSKTLATPSWSLAEHST